MWWCQFIDWLKNETRPSSLLNFGTAYLDSNAGIACLAWASSDADKIEIFLFSWQCPRGCHRHCLSSLI